MDQNLLQVDANALTDIIPRRYIRDVSNPYEIAESDFKKKYRFSQDSVNYLISLIENDLKAPDNRGFPLHPKISVLIVLRFYATGAYQNVYAELMDVSQSTVSKYVAKITELLAKLHSQFIKFPSAVDNTVNRQLFKRLGQHGRWPGLDFIDGAIDCTHIKIVSTPGCQHHEAFRNRKSDFSINVQVVCGPRFEILDIVARWAGSTHDSRIFQMSSLNTKYQQGLLDGRLVGDNGYPSLPYLLTPIKPTPEDAPSLRYNRAQIKTRNIVERTFGVWKSRFPCLKRGLTNKLSTVCHIIVACAVLHNIALNQNDQLFENDIPDEEGESAQNNNDMANTVSGFDLRNSIIQNYYT